MLPRVRKLGLRIENTITRATSPIGAAFSAQKLIWRAWVTTDETIVGGRSASILVMMLTVLVCLIAGEVVCRSVIGTPPHSWMRLRFFWVSSVVEQVLKRVLELFERLRERFDCIGCDVGRNESGR
ncbi:hypothetical protein GCM10008097_07100 [Mycetocola manganoxydans]|nr:hypothetical protein GCM10008097_07100 [Mycetocola manganoxydans]